MSHKDPALTRRRFLGGAGALSASLVLPVLPRMSEAQAATAHGLLMRGAAVVYFRHGATTWSGIDQLDWPRARQRLLSDLGIAQSEQIGAAFRDQGFAVGDVLASPFARCRDMAEIAFGRVEERMELVGLLSDSAGRPARVAYLRDQLSRPTEGGNRMIVAHRSNISEVAGVTLAEGDAVVVAPNGTGFEVIARVAPDQWSTLAG